MRDRDKERLKTDGEKRCGSYVCALSGKALDVEISLNDPHSVFGLLHFASGFAVLIAC